VRDIQETLKERHPGGIDEHAMKQAVNLIAHFVPKSMMAESFRALRAGIQFKNTEKKIKTLAITSASPQEGKTLVAVNLAITMAQAGMKTLLVGSDLRKPTLARILGVEATRASRIFCSETLMAENRERHHRSRHGGDFPG
jgi:polysaccharide biosynthesis transport protein